MFPKKYSNLLFILVMGFGMSLLMTLIVETSSSASSEANDHRTTPQFMRVAWLGQTIASLCWVCSMGFYGVNSIGDWLQLAAGLAWFIANIASLNDA